MQQPFPPMMPQFNFMAPKGGLAPALYIGDLDENIQEETLYDFFSRFGGIHFVRIMRDSTTGKSRGYAFVNFVQPRDAESAKQYAQYEKLGKKHIRIMFKRAIRDIPDEANVYVKNIDPSTNVKDLHTHFNGAGVVLSAKIATDNQGNSLGYGYVQFEKPEDADNAIHQFNGTKLGEKELVVQKFVRKDKRPTIGAKKNVYIKNLPLTGDQKSIESLVEKRFSQFGEIEKMAAVQKNDKWAAFVCYKTPEEATQAINYFNEHKEKLGDAEEELFVCLHQSKKERQQELSQSHTKASNNTNLYIKNLRLDVKEEELKNAFIQFGPITSIGIKTWKSTTGQKEAKCGFIAFGNADDAKKALQSALETPQVKALYIPTEALYINLHQPKDKRTEFIQSKKRGKMQMAPMYDFRQPFINPLNNNRRFPPMPGVMQPMYGMNRPQNPNKVRMPNQGGYNQPRPNNPTRGGPGFNNRPYQNPRPQGGMQPMKSNPHQQPIQQKKPQEKPQQQPQQVQKQPTQAAPTQTSQIAFSSLKNRLNEFLGMPQEKQRQILGELLFPKIRALTTEQLAPKITGMLIDLSVLEVGEILEFLEDESLLKERVDEAAELILSEDQ